jgi:lysophospholipase L1-like esterase
MTTATWDTKDGNTSIGRQWGKPTLVFVSGSGSAGDVIIKRFDSAAKVSSTPHLLIYGDSNTEISNIAQDYPDGWSYVLEDMRGRGDTLTMARGSLDSTELGDYFASDLTPFSPRYALLMIGTNDANRPQTRAGVQAWINAVVARGAIPILATNIPHTGSESLQANINADVRSGTQYTVSGVVTAIPYVDMALAVCQGGLVANETVWDPRYDSGDGTHANRLGMIRMLQRVMIDQPQLLDYVSASTWLGTYSVAAANDPYYGPLRRAG